MGITSEWQKLTGPIDLSDENLPSLSVIIAARNEGSYIESCLNSLINQGYPKERYEIILIDDGSQDDTVEKARKYNDSIIIETNSEGNQGKKSAIKYGVSLSRFDTLVFSDADCTYSHQWLLRIGNYVGKEKPNFLAGLVVPSYKHDFLSAFQFLDFLSLMQITGAGIQSKEYFLANGANMVVDKATFLKAKSENKYEEVASGDDIFLINEINSLGIKGIRFLKDNKAVVSTKSEPTWKAFFTQRKRWASKTKHYAGNDLTKLQFYIFIVHLVIVLNFLLSPFTEGFTFIIGLFMLFIKACIDYLFLSKMADFMDNRKPLRYFLPSFFMYFILIIYSAITVLITKKYKWKDRRVE